MGPDHQQTPSFSPCFEDVTLTAFAQLGALRLNVACALISLLDAKNQYIITRATQTTSLSSDDGDQGTDFHKGRVSSRHDQLCEYVLRSQDLPEEMTSLQSGTIFINNLDQHTLLKNRSYWKFNAGYRFYAGTPIETADGTRIGVYCVYDTNPERGLSTDDERFLNSMARSVMGHLETLRVQAEFKRRSKLVSGLETFVDGFSAIPHLSYSSEPLGEIQEQRWSSENPRGKTQQPAQAPTLDVNAQADSRLESKSHVPSTYRPEPATPETLWQKSLSHGSQKMFARAAHIVRECGDYDGVAYFYVATAQDWASAYKQSDPTDQSDQRNVTPASDRDSPPVLKSSSSDEFPTSKGAKPDSGLSGDAALPNDPCTVLGSSVRTQKALDEMDSAGRFKEFTSRDLEILLGKRPRSKVVSIVPSQESLIEDPESSGTPIETSLLVPSEQSSLHVANSHPAADHTGQVRKKIRGYRLAALQKLAPTARNFVILPLWDYERQRWFACCICWTDAARKPIDLDGDLQYLRIFGNSVMMALSRLDATASGRAKTSFVASISHELRSPLHGVLGAVDFLHDTKLTTFQREMIGSISSCGHTLLDTLDHVMDFARINSEQNPQFIPKKSKDRAAESTQKQTSVVQVRSSTFDLAALVEEVSEALWLGFSVHDEREKENTTPASSRPLVLRHKSIESMSRRGHLRIALYIHYHPNWRVVMQAGAVRRIVMNLLGNALKYTTEGFATVRLHMEAADAQTVRVVLSIVDTGCGISDDYQRDHLFKAFSQEDSLSAGSGLGLSIVKQITDDLGGQIRLSSAKGQGTHTAVSLTIPISNGITPSIDLPQRSSSIDTIRMKTRGMRIRILSNVAVLVANEHADAAVQAEKEQGQGLKQILADWFDADIALIYEWQPGSADILIMLEPDFKALKQVEDANSSPEKVHVLILTYDVVEMSALRSDDRIIKSRLVIEIITQP